MTYKEKALEAVVYFNNYWKTNKLNTPSLIPDIIGSRQDVAQIQSFLLSQHFNAGKVDGLWGEQTDIAYNMFKEKTKTGKIVNFRTDTTNNVTYLKTEYPSYKNIESYYGKIEDISKNIVTVSVPFKHILAWNPRQVVNKVSCHKKIASVYTTILEETLATYGLDEIHKLGIDLFGGSFVSPPRKMRGGSEWSTHCYGISFDYNPEANQLKWGRDKAVFATPEYADFMDIWNKYGAINIGECKGYDYMHMQFSTF